MNICRFLVAAARRAPEHAAVSFGTRVVYTYRELNDRVRSLASWLTGKLGLRSGDRVALVMENCHQYLEIRYAAWYAGLIVVPINSKLHAKEFEFVLQDSGAAVCFVTTNLMATITAAVNKCENRVMILDVNSDQYKSCFSRSFEANLVDLDCDHVAWLFYCMLLLFLMVQGSMICRMLCGMQIRYSH
jgi:long-chain acyl-CoA synthetase